MPNMTKIQLWFAGGMPLEAAGLRVNIASPIRTGQRVPAMAEASTMARFLRCTLDEVYAEARVAVDARFARETSAAAIARHDA